MIVKPACPKCGLFYYPKKNGFSFIEGMPNGTFGPGETPTGHKGRAYWQDYKLWHGDLWACRGCGAEVIVGVIAGPVAEHYQPEFKKYKEMLEPTCFIADC